MSHELNDFWLTRFYFVIEVTSVITEMKLKCLLEHIMVIGTNSLRFQ